MAPQPKPEGNTSQVNSGLAVRRTDGSLLPQDGVREHSDGSGPGTGQCPEAVDFCHNEES